MGRIEYRPFGRLHYGDRSESHRPQAIPKYLVPYPDTTTSITSHAGNIFYDTLICAAVHSAEVDPDLRKAILTSTESDKALEAVESMIFQDPLISSLVGTTRAVDIVGGGVKA